MTIKRIHTAKSADVSRELHSFETCSSANQELPGKPVTEIKDMDLSSECLTNEELKSATTTCNNVQLIKNERRFIFQAKVHTGMSG